LEEVFLIGCFSRHAVIEPYRCWFAAHMDGLDADEPETPHHRYLFHRFVYQYHLGRFSSILLEMVRLLLSSLGVLHLIGLSYSPSSTKSSSSKKNASTTISGRPSPASSSGTTGTSLKGLTKTRRIQILSRVWSRL
jgi:hypothetical protein